MKLKNRHNLKNKQLNEIKKQFNTEFNSINFPDKNSMIETASANGIEFILVNKKPYFFKYHDKIFFTLLGINKFKPLEKGVTVDMGAIKFITNGADVMAPGIVDADKNIEIDDQVWIQDENHHEPLAVGIASINGGAMTRQKKGKAIEVVHYVGDKIWNFFAKSL